MNQMRPIHPGEILREEYLEPVGHERQCAGHRAAGLPRHGSMTWCGSGAALRWIPALRLARYFNTTPMYWMNLQAAYELKAARRKQDEIEREVLPLQRAS